MFVYYRNKKTGDLEAKYEGCDTQSIKFRNIKEYERFESDLDLPLNIIPEPDELGILIGSSDGSIWMLQIDDNGNVKTKKVK